MRSSNLKEKWSLKLFVRESEQKESTKMHVAKVFTSVQNIFKKDEPEKEVVNFEDLKDEEDLNEYVADFERLQTMQQNMNKLLGTQKNSPEGKFLGGAFSKMCGVFLFNFC